MSTVDSPVAQLVYFEGGIIFKGSTNVTAWSEIASYEDVLEMARELSGLEKSAIELVSGPVLITEGLYDAIVKESQRRENFVLGIIVKKIS